MCGSKAEGLVSWCGLSMTPKKSLLRTDLVVSEKDQAFEINSKHAENAGSVPARAGGRKRYCGYGSFHM